jgi:hypothetical protein
VLLQEHGHGLEDAGRVEGPDGQQDAEEEEDARHVDLGQRGRHAQALLLVACAAAGGEGTFKVWMETGGTWLVRDWSMDIMDTCIGMSHG